MDYKVEGLRPKKTWRKVKWKKAVGPNN